MADNDELSNNRLQALAERKYAELKRAVEEAGYFVNEVVGDQYGDGIVCTSKYQEGHGYTGRIVFVTEAGGNWYFATPHPYHYRVLEPSRVGQALVAFLGQRLNRSVQNAEAVGDLHGGFVRIDYKEYEQAVGKA